MFNKTAIIKRERSKFSYNPKPRTSNKKMKKYLINLKVNFLNNNNSSNVSNPNLKTSSNSKIVPESNSIRKVQTQYIPKVKKSLFDIKEQKQNYRNFSTKKSLNNNPYNDISLSEKINKHFKIKNKSRSHFNNEENERHSKAYYLTGELPYRDKYIVEIKDYNVMGDETLKLEKKNELIKNKNEFIQCNSINGHNNRSYNSKILNMRKKDKRIDKLARKLALKLNIDKNQNQKSKCGCGNLITLKNGFFNGVNLVMSYSPLKGYNKLTNDNSDKKYDFPYNPTEPNGYNFIPTNLPIFLRDKYNIKGTDVLSPFCIEARDEFLFKKIFYEGEKKKLSRRTNVIDNKLNIFYAENLKQYDKNLIKFNEKLRSKGKRIIHEVGPTPTENKLNTIKKKMKFMKKIVDYAYPNMVLARVRETEKIYKKKNLSDINLPPFKKVENIEKKRNNILGDYLRQSIIIKNQ